MGTITIDGKIYEYASVSIVTGPGEPPIPAPPPPPPAPQPPPVTGLARELRLKENNIYPFGKGDKLTIPFNSGPARGLDQISIGEYMGAPSVKYAKLSDKPFDYVPHELISGGDFLGNAGSVYFSVGEPNAYGYLILKPNTTYYLNVSDTNPITGQSGCSSDSCQFVAV